MPVYFNQVLFGCWCTQYAYQVPGFSWALGRALSSCTTVLVSIFSMNSDVLDIGTSVLGSGISLDALVNMCQLFECGEGFSLNTRLWFSFRSRTREIVSNEIYCQYWLKSSAKFSSSTVRCNFKTSFHWFIKLLPLLWQTYNVNLILICLRHNTVFLCVWLTTLYSAEMLTQLLDL